MLYSEKSHRAKEGEIVYETEWHNESFDYYKSGGELKVISPDGEYPGGLDTTSAHTIYYTPNVPPSIDKSKSTYYR